MKPKDLLEHLEKGNRTVEVLKGEAEPKMVLTEERIEDFSRLVDASFGMRAAQQLAQTATQQMNQQLQQQAAQQLGDTIRYAQYASSSSIDNWRSISSRW